MSVADRIVLALTHNSTNMPRGSSDEMISDVMGITVAYEVNMREGHEWKKSDHMAKLAFVKKVLFEDCGWSSS